ncbi:MAG: Ppx/GppA phosphatase family protein [Syntrophomonadaceae bacterium]|nr:Ppx/GppA phosphatase family protein [Syntrophomonadaceae bacterium]
MKKLAIIDMGSNSIRLVLVHIGREGNYKIVHDLKESARLARDFCPELTIKPQRADMAVKIMTMFRRLCRVVEPDEIIVVATDAVRRALNRDEFLARIKEETGFEVRVLSGREEAFYDYLGVVNGMKVEDALLMDIGGGSTEIVWVKDRQAVEMTSFPLGAINLAQLFGLHDRISQLQEDSLQNKLFESFARIPWLKESGSPVLIGIGGSFRNIGRVDRRLKNYPLDLPHNYRFEAADVQKIYNHIKNKSAKQRQRIKGLSRDRADIIAGATFMVNTLLEYCDIPEIRISGYGLREGIIYDYIHRNHDFSRDVLDCSINNNIKNYSLDYQHASTVYRLASSLFEQLQEICSPEEDLSQVIKTAAMLHDCGIVINYYQQNEHIFYTMLNLEINGLSHRELVLSACVAAYHDKKTPVQISGFAPLLQSRDLLIIRQMGVMLRLARSLDRSMSGIVNDLKVDIRGDDVIIKTISIDNAELEIYDALQHFDEFKKIFNKNLFIM